ncbi:MAG: hypothetical protein ACP5GJ_02320 [Nanopusillaceae archaeon]
MDWKKVVLVAVFSLVAVYLQTIGIIAAVSLLIYMLVKGMDNCKIANLGLLLEFIGIFLYLFSSLQTYSINLGISATASAYLILTGVLLVLIGVIIVMLVYNKLKGNIYES